MAKASGKPTTLCNPLPPADLAAALESGTDLRMVDVRTPAEYESMHIDGSHNIPLDELAGYADQIAAIRVPIIVVCRSGARARSAEALLRRAGARTLYVLDGGILSWTDAGQPVRKKPLSLRDVPRFVSGMFGFAATRDRSAAVAALTTDTHGLPAASIASREPARRA